MSLQMMHARPCASRCSSPSSSSSSWMMQAQPPPKQSHNPLSGRSSVPSEPLAVLALHLLLKKRHRRQHSRSGNTAMRTPASSPGSLQITAENKSNGLTKAKVTSAERRALLADALDRDKQLDRLNYCFMHDQECAGLQKIREKMIKEGQEVSYQSWAETAGIDEAVLKSRLQEGYCCRERLLVTTEWLVKYIARSYTGMGTAFDDLLQAGKMGVLDGAEKFDSQKGCKFSTYVKYWIRKGMLALLVENSGVTLLPARMESIIRKVKDERRAIRHSAGRNPSDPEVAAIVGVSVANVRLARKCSRRVVSLYTEVGLEHKANFAEVIPDPSVESPDEALFRSQLRERLLQVLDRLPEREGQVLKLRHGLEDGKCRSLEHIGRVYSVSKEWIRKIEKSAVAKLRNDDVRRQLLDFYRYH